MIEEKELIKPTTPADTGINKKKNFKSLAFLNLTNTSIKAMHANTTKAKYKLENTDIVMRSKVSVLDIYYQPEIAKISAVWSLVSGFSIICCTKPASSIKKVVLVVPI